MLPTQSASLKIFVTPIISFFRAESKLDRTQKQATPRAVKSTRGVAVFLIIILLRLCKPEFSIYRIPEISHDLSTHFNITVI